MEEITKLYEEVINNFGELTLYSFNEASEDNITYKSIKNLPYSDIDITFEQALECIKKSDEISLEELTKSIVKLRKVISQEHYNNKELMEKDELLYDSFLILANHDRVEIKYEALWCITNICIDKSCADQFLERNLKSILKSNISTKYKEIVEQAIWTVYNIIGESEIYVNNIMDEDLIEEIFKYLIAVDNKKVTLDAICNITKRKVKNVLIPTMKNMLVYLTKVFPDYFHNEDEIYNIVFIFCSSLENSHELTDFIVKKNLFRFISSLMLTKLQNGDYFNNKILLTLVRGFGNICANEDPSFTDHALDLKFIDFSEFCIKNTESTNKLLRKEVYWILSNISAGTDDQCMEVFNNTYLLNSIVESVNNKNEYPEVRKEAIFAFSNILVKKLPVVREFALREETIETILQLKNLTDYEISCGVLLEALSELILSNNFPEISKGHLYNKLNKSNFYEDLKNLKEVMKWSKVCTKKIKLILKEMENDKNHITSKHITANGHLLNIN